MSEIPKYGLHRLDKTAKRTMSATIPTYAELMLMLYRAYLNAEAEAKRAARAKAASRKGGRRKVGRSGHQSQDSIVGGATSDDAAVPESNN